MKKLIGGWSRLIIGIVIVVLAIITIGCNSSKSNNNALLALLGLISPPPAASYTVTYDNNTSTSGSVPTDSNTYTAGATVIILGNTGTLAKTGFTFAGWNTVADGSGTTYSQGQHCTMGAANLTLYARWTNQPTYTVTYSGNGSTGGSALIDTTNYTTGQIVTVFDPGTLVRAGYSFNGWNTASNGSGTSYTATQTFSMGSTNVTLYAQWTALPTYIVTYNDNVSSSGSVPTDPASYYTGQTVTVLSNSGNLKKTGYSFGGWNTVANGSGTTYAVGQTFSMGSGNTTLFAYWKENYTQDKKDYNPSATQTGETVTVFTSEADFANTYALNNFNGTIQGIIPAFFQESIVKSSCTVSVKSSTGAGGDTLWMTNDDTGQSYAVNTFDASGKISRTDVYSDFTGTTRTGYSVYTLNGDGTYQKVLTYNDSDVLQNSVYFTFSSSLVTQIDQWSGDGTGTHLKALSFSYDGSNRWNIVTYQINSVNQVQMDFDYTGTNIAASSQVFYSWDGSAWTWWTTATHTVNGAGTRITHTSFSPAFNGIGSTDDTFNASNYNQQRTTYNDVGSEISHSVYTYN